MNIKAQLILSVGGSLYLGGVWLTYHLNRRRMRQKIDRLNQFMAKVGKAAITIRDHDGCGRKLPSGDVVFCDDARLSDEREARCGCKTVALAAVSAIEVK